MAFDLHNLEREKFNINCAVNKGFLRMPWLRYSPEVFEIEKRMATGWKKILAARRGVDQYRHW
jgi:hypothetical protein